MNLCKISSGVLSVHGKDAIDFLHRLSTNHVLGLPDGGVVPTVLTTEKGRIVDVVLVVSKGDHLLLVCASPEAVRVKEWLEKFIILEDVQVFDVTNEYSTYKLIGTEAISYVINCLKAGPWEEGRIASHQFNGCGAVLFRDPLWQVPAVTLLFISECEESILHGMKALSTGECLLNFIELSQYERIRIELGVPASGRELSEHVNPLEAGLEKFVNFTKGCYIGQEVIARLDTYQKVQKHLSGFLFATADMEKLPPGIIYQDGTEAGWTTSHTFSQSLNAGIALGFLNSGITSPRIEFVPAGSKDIYPGTVQELPFIKP